MAKVVKQVGQCIAGKETTKTVELCSVRCLILQLNTTQQKSRSLRTDNIEDMDSIVPSRHLNTSIESYLSHRMLELLYQALSYLEQDRKFVYEAEIRPLRVNLRPRIKRYLKRLMLMEDSWRIDLLLQISVVLSVRLALFATLLSLHGSHSTASKVYEVWILTSNALHQSMSSDFLRATTWESKHLVFEVAVDCANVDAIFVAGFDSVNSIA